MDIKPLRVLVGCEFSQIVTKAFRDRGHEAYSCDILPTEGTPDWHIQGDVLDHLDDGFDLMIAHPECTYLTVTGNKWMKNEFEKRFPGRKQKRDDAVNFFMKLVNAPIEMICIENPIGIMSTRYAKPSQIIQPFQFGHPEPKSTCLWLKGLPKLRPTEIVPPEYTTTKTSGKRLATWYYFNKNMTVAERKTLRSRTFQGIADAMADQFGDFKGIDAWGGL